MKYFLNITALLFSMMMTGCSDKSEFYEPQAFLMGTVITGKVYGKNREKASSEVINRISEIEKMMTINSPGGDINKLNSMSGKDYVALNPESVYVMNVANRYSELSGGAFDVTIGPLVKAWAIGTDNPRIPEIAEIKSLLKLVSYKDLVIDEKNNKAMLKKQNQVVDLGGIAKGYAGDEAVRILKDNKITSAYVNLGGNVVTLGKKPDGSLWRIAVQNPRAANGKYVGILEVADKAIVTSGDYERFFEKDNVRYHHILDTKTGNPAKSGLIAVTIVYDRSVDADALSTSLFILGMDEGKKLISSIKGAEAVFINIKKEIYITGGLKDIFTFKDDTGEFVFKGTLK
jgi:thiamine biosynthesis lipoprotein